MFPRSPKRSAINQSLFRPQSTNNSCRYCHNVGNVYNVCGCSYPNNLAHIQCLIRTISNSVSGYCPYCSQPFRGVVVTFNRPSCREWYRRDERAKFDLIIIPLIVIFFYYLAYLGYLNYVTNYLIYNKIIQYILINLITFIFVTSIMSTFLSALKIIVDIEDWRRRHTDVVAVPLFPTERETSS